MKRFLRSKLILSFAAFMMIAAAIAIPLSGSLTRIHAQAPTTVKPSVSPTLAKPSRSTSHQHTSVTATDITITSTTGWQPTALTVQRGTYFGISYTSGTWTVDYRSIPYVDPDGYPPNIDKQIYQGCKYNSSLPYATLLGQIGTGPSFRVGTGGVFKASATGIISLRINDQDACLGDNDGSIVLQGLSLIPGMRLPWDRTLTNIPLNGGPHSNANAGNSCAPDPFSSLSGLDFGLLENTDVLAVADGKVVFAGDIGPPIRGEVIVDHGNGFITEYWHLNAESVATGANITQGTLIGKSGWSPNKDGSHSVHLHLEFRQYMTDPLQNTPYSAQGMLIDGYQAWTFKNSSGQGLNYEGTMTRGVAKTQPIIDTFCNNQSVTKWYAPKGITIMAESDRTGGNLLSTNAEVRLSNKTGKFFYNQNNSGTFDIAPSTQPVFTQKFGAFLFNPPSSSTSDNSLLVFKQTCIKSTGVDEYTRPFTDVTPNTDGSCGMAIAQGNGLQAGSNTLQSFEAVFTANLTVPYAGKVVFHVYADDGWILSIGPSNGNQPTPDPGNIMTNPPSGNKGPFTGYPEMGDNNIQSTPTSFTIAATFPAAGSYPIELDYTECCQGQLTLVFVPGYN